MKKKKRKKLKKKCRNVFFYKLNIEKKIDFKNIPQSDLIVHLLGVSYKRNDSFKKKFSTKDIINSNFLGMKNLINYIKKNKTKKIIFISSMSVYGQNKDKIVNENTHINKPDFYGESKLYGEKLLKEISNKLK